MTASRRVTAADLRRIGRALDSTVTDVGQTTRDGVTTFATADGSAICCAGPWDPSERLALWCPAPPGVAEEMASSEPSRFFLADPPTGAGSTWLGTFLDGTGDDAVDWDEIAAILADAVEMAGRHASETSVSGSHIQPGGPYSFTAPLWVHSSGSWHFVTVPIDVGTAMAEHGALLRRGFGSLRVRVTLGPSTWDTSVFPEGDNGSFVLPIKKPVRTKAGIEPGDLVEITLSLVDAD